MSSSRQFSKHPRPSPDEAAVDEDRRQYGSGALSLDEIDSQFPRRPRNHSRTFLFSELYLSLFNPLLECKPSTGGAPAAAVKRRTGRGNPGSSKVSYHEQRRHIIERFMSRWRAEVGLDFYPAMRLILPDKDRDRGVYGLKESTIGKLLVKVMKIDRHSEDGYGLMHWKLPGHGRGGGGGGVSGGRSSAGDFAGRVLEVVGKREMRSEPGELTIGDVNVLLDRLAAASGEAEQVPIFEEIYQKMNAEEIMWLVRIILKEMKVGATERTFLGLWHPDAEALFSVSSSLRRVCWELYDPGFRLEQQETGITLMQCFQPQLAQFQMTTTWDKLVRNLGVTEEEPEFWIEEKLDGERMQMHMTTDDTVPGGYRFAFWSRKAKDYTYLYGSGLQDDNSALTRHLKNAFDEGVRNLILDGEMVTWDPDVDKMVPFGTLKTAALDQQKNPFQTGPRPLYRVFDILLLNDKCLTEYTLADRHKALERAVKGEPRRLEIHTYETATSAAAIEPMLRNVVAEASEGLVLKNPRSRYQLNSRNNDWIKVKPEYMSEFGESLDCVVIGGYFGSGRRGGTLSSFLCGLRVSQNYIKAGANPEKCLSVCKVGGGFKAEDYAEIKHHTEGKWRDWDSANPPSYFIELGGGERLQYEKPDVWIRPKDSIVLEIKAASISPSDQFATGWTLRFPRFKKLRLDKAWDAGLDIDEFEALKNKVTQDVEERKAMEMESRKRRPTKRAKQGIVIAGTTRDVTTGAAAELLSFAPPSSSKGVFDGLDFCVLSESVKPLKMSKPDLERLIKEHGGRIHQQVEKGSSTIAVADKNVVKVASLKKQGDVDIVRPRWVFDCLAQDGRRGYLLPFEQVHLLHGTEMTTEKAAENMDQFGDSYFSDVKPEELADIFDKMPYGPSPQRLDHKQHMRKKPRKSAADILRERLGDRLSEAEIQEHVHSMGADLNLYPEEEEENRGGFDAFKFLDQLEDHGRGLDDLQSFLFRRCIVYFSTSPGVSKTKTLRLANYVRFGGGFVFDVLTDDDEHEDDVYDVTHVVVVAKDDASEREQAAHLRERLCYREHMPRIVTQRWVEACWREKTLLDEERFTPA